MKNHFIPWITSVAFGIGGVSVLHAGVVTKVLPTPETLTASSAVDSSPCNATRNTIRYRTNTGKKTIPLGITGFDPMDLQLTVSDQADPDARTAYRVTIQLKNLSAFTWNAFNVSLGVGSGSSFVNLQDLPSTLEGLTFDSSLATGITPIFNTYYPSQQSPTSLQWNDNWVVPSSNQILLLFGIMVPNGDPAMGGTYDFTLRLDPMHLPEPASGLMLLLALPVLWNRHQCLPDQFIRS